MFRSVAYPLLGVHVYVHQLYSAGKLLRWASVSAGSQFGAVWRVLEFTLHTVTGLVRVVYALHGMMRLVSAVTNVHWVDLVCPRDLVCRGRGRPAWFGT